MPNDLHCPQCLTRISPYEDEVNDIAQKGVMRNACWHCGLPMEDVLAKQNLTSKPDRRTAGEKEIEDLRAELARLKAEAAAPEMPEERPHGMAEAFAEPEKPRGIPSSVEAAAHRGPGRPPAKK